MEFLFDIEWFINHSPSSAVNKNTNKKLTEKELSTIIFDDIKKVNLVFPLHDNLLYTEKRLIQTPITVKDLLTIIYLFYKDPLLEEQFENAFKDMEEWKTDLLDSIGSTSKITKYDVFTDICAPYFSGIEKGENNEYHIIIGPL